MTGERAAMSKRHILIASIYYAPEQTGIAVNTTGLAEGLASRGWSVTVITGIPHYPAWRPRATPSPNRDGPVEVIRSKHFVPRRQSLTRRAAYEASWLAASLSKVLMRRDVDIILGVTPNLGGAALAAFGAVRSRVPYVLMFQDLLGHAARQSSFPHAGLVAGGLERLELSLASRAAGVAVVAEGFRSYLVESGIPANRIHQVRNPVRTGTPKSGREETRRRLGWLEDEFVVLHSGNMGFKQGLENVLHAAARASSADSIRFVLQGDGNQRASLQRLAMRLDVRNVTFAPLVPDDELPDVLTAADLLLVNQRGDVRDMSFPAKLTSYFAAGRPVVAVVAGDSEAGREVAASGGGFVVEPDCPEALLAAVRELAGRPALRAQLGANGSAFAESELRPEATLEQMDQLLNTVLAAHSRNPAEAQQNVADTQ